MTAGGGVLHIERPPEHLVTSGGLFHGLQLWVNLPAKLKWAEPRYQDPAVRDEHPRGSHGSLRRLSSRPAGHHPGPGPLTALSFFSSPARMLERSSNRGP
ncbi:MAG: hypothetical protein ACRDRG_21490 [Pseudonocardiaceae bacterium]